MTKLVFTIVILSEIFLGGSLIFTLLKPAMRVWPPSSRSSWQYRYIWTLTTTSLVGAAVLGVLDWNSSFLNHWSRFVVGGALIFGGLSFALWGVRSLGIHASLGLGGELVDAGAYRYSRNPQYVGDIALLVGYAVVCNSLYVWVAVAFGCAWFVLAPFTEEPWLRERFGKTYDEYTIKVPRFIGI